MNILDNDSDFNFDLPQDVDSNFVTSQSMTALWDLVIEPMEDKLSDADKSLISIIGISLKLVAHKAAAYEKLQNSEFPDPKENDFNRN